jgi:hypothetical protein
VKKLGNHYLYPLEYHRLVNPSPLVLLFQILNWPIFPLFIHQQPLHILLLRLKLIDEFKGLFQIHLSILEHVYTSSVSESRVTLLRQLSSMVIWTVVVSAVQRGDWSLEIVVKFRPGRVETSCKVRSDKLNDLLSLPTECKCKLWRDVERLVFLSRSVVLPSIMELRILMLFAIIELFWWVMAVINLQFGWWPLWAEARRSRC